jgi:hypothetical protein
MTPGHVLLSRRAALVSNFLSPVAREKFIDATNGRAGPDQVGQPYRSWLLDVTTIPERDRAHYVDPVTGDLVVRSIDRNI